MEPKPGVTGTEPAQPGPWPSLNVGMIITFTFVTYDDESQFCIHTNGHIFVEVKENSLSKKF